MPESLPAVLSGSENSLDINPRTPLIQALADRLEDGIDLLNATRDLMAQSGLLEGIAANLGLAERLKIRGALERLQKAGIILMEPGEKHIRLTTLAEQREPQKIELEASTGRSAARGSATFAFSADASLSLSLTVAEPAAAQAAGLPIGESDVLHRCTFGGNLGVAGNVKATRNAGAISGEFSAGAEAAAGITWSFQRHREDTVLASLVDAAIELSDGACPWDLAQVRRVLEQPAQAGRHMDALRAIDVVANRSVSFSGKATASYGFVGTTQVDGATGPADIQLAAAASIGFGFSATSSGALQLRLTRMGDQIVLELGQERSRRTGRELTAGLSVGINGLDTLAQGYLDKLLLPIDKDLLKKLDAWSKPGSVFVDRLKEKLGDRWGDELLPLAEVVFGEVSAADAAQALSERLIDRWASQLDQRIGVLDERAEAVVARLLQSDAEDGSLEAQASAALQSSISEVIASLQADIEMEIEAYVATLKDKSKKQLTKLLEPLEAVGERVNALVTAVDDRATKIVSAIRKLLKRYEDLRKQLTAATQKAAALKLGVAFSASSSVEKGVSQALCLHFAPGANAEATALFKRLVLGQGVIELDDIARLESKGAGVRIESGGFSAFARRESAMSLSLDLFGLTFADSRVLGSEVVIDVDAAGRIRAFDARSTQTRFSDNPRSQQSANFSADFDLLAAQPDQLPGTLGLAFDLAGKKPLSADALGQFLGSFVDAGLIERSTATRAILRLEEDSDRRLAVTVTLSGLNQVMARSRSVPTALLQADVLDDCLRLMRRRNELVGRVLPDLPFDSLLTWVQRSRSDFAADRATRETLTSRPELRQISQDERPGSDFDSISLEYRALHHAIVCIPASVDALAEIGRLAADVQSRPLTQSDALAARDRLDRLVNNLQRAATPAVDTKSALSRLLSERLPDRTIALLAAFARLGEGSEFRVTITLQRVSFDTQGQRVLGEKLEF